MDSLIDCGIERIDTRWCMVHERYESRYFSPCFQPFSGEVGYPEAD